tara:strand:- start:341 stop:574 length:234 start_codon:yes stop_codon:yes gene_type:complete
MTTITSKNDVNNKTSTIIKTNQEDENTSNDSFESLQKEYKQTCSTYRQKIFSVAPNGAFWANDGYDDYFFDENGDEC